MERISASPRRTPEIGRSVRRAACPSRTPVPALTFHGAVRRSLEAPRDRLGIPRWRGHLTQAGRPRKQSIHHGRFTSAVDSLVGDVPDQSENMRVATDEPAVEAPNADGLTPTPPVPEDTRLIPRGGDRSGPSSKRRTARLASASTEPLTGSMGKPANRQHRSDAVEAPAEVVRTHGLACSSRAVPTQRRPVPVDHVKQARLGRPAPHDHRAEVRAGAPRHHRLPRRRPEPRHARLAGQRPRPVRARSSVGQERDRLWQRWVSVDPSIEVDAGRRSTETPVIVLEPRDANA